MKKLLFLFAIFAISCNPFENISEVKKREEALKNPRFKELPEEEMYAFLNEVYLPRLDSSERQKRIFIYPRIYTPRVADDTIPENKSIWPPRKKELRLSDLPFSLPPLAVDSNRAWNKYKMAGIKFIENLDEEAPPYTFVSLPMRDTKKGTILIEEYYISNSMCCLCSAEQLFFLKTDSGWRQIPRY